MYTIKYIQELKNNINIELEPIIKHFLEDIIKDVIKDHNNIIDTYDMYKNKYDRKKKKELIVNKNVETKSYKNIERIKEINNRTDDELNMINIKKILNKLSFQNFTKLKNEFICHYTELYNNNKNINDFNIFIFESFLYTNTIFVDLYIELFILLNNINPLFSNILNNTYLNDFLNVHTKINISYTNNNEEIFTNNKNNDKIKSMYVFYIKAYINKILNEIYLYNSIDILQNELFHKLQQVDNKLYCEELTNFILIFISNMYKYISNNIKYKNIYHKIEKISSYKNNELPSITNKIIFKHKNIHEKYKII